MVAEAVPDAKGALLNRVLDHLAAEGVGDRSLRQIAAGAGTSHRMLIYHFGTREGLLGEVVREVEDRQRAALAGLRTGGKPPDAVARAFWRRLSDPALAPYARLFFELHGQSLGGRAGAASPLGGTVEPWLADLAELAAPGRPPEDPVRRARARMAVAFARGALLDLLATGEREEVDSAVEEFFAIFFSDN
ncbi:TetR/AcrR family transcriptional regulator [Amycolatopsis nigrescens]|uniref:TetR/AcrR family transcriptional regulator n=1 Tax=Amycolatopsis nigrescens TaxID=381445 RepID=UPI00036369F1|nr:TetR/AcrR family transcriptional regulator [Amycolatopsis nigrescens]